MTAALNHTIVWCRDQEKSATFMAGLLGLRPLGGGEEGTIGGRVEGGVATAVFGGQGTVAFETRGTTYVNVPLALDATVAIRLVPARMETRVATPS